MRASLWAVAMMPSALPSRPFILRQYSPSLVFDRSRPKPTRRRASPRRFLTLRVALRRTLPPLMALQGHRPSQAQNPSALLKEVSRCSRLPISLIRLTITPGSMPSMRVRSVPKYLWLSFGFLAVAGWNSSRRKRLRATRVAWSLAARAVGWARRGWHCGGHRRGGAPFRRRLRFALG